jgi:2-polyprenyl-6-methoxyphenol hydroxylase-like FAD-dependent oxidoreductase
MADCVVVGGGPAGVVLGLLLSRCGVDVVVLEKHADFLRDFRGDTVHASTLGLVDELGLGERFAALPHRVEQRVEIVFDDGRVAPQFGRLPGRHQHIALVPQWDFLAMLVDAARESPKFRIVMSAEVEDVLRENGRVAGVRWVDRATGAGHELRADLVVGCDGRHSRVREILALPRRDLAAPFDCLYARLPMHDSDPDRTMVRFSARGGVVMVNRNTYWQVAVLIGKGDPDAAGLMRRSIRTLAPVLADRVDAVTAADIARLEVRQDRLRRWWAPGALCIGDAAHAMTPVAGVGINLAIQDAVAAARILVPPLRAGSVTDRDLAAVQRRRIVPTVLTQALQRETQRRAIVTPARDPDETRPPLRVPQPLRTLRHVPGFLHLFGRVVALGLQPEHLTGPLEAASCDARNQTGRPER